MANELTKKDENVLALVNGDHSIEELIKPLSHEIFLFDSFVAGTTFIKNETVFDELKVGDKLILQREADNRFDENAVLILDAKQRKLGYIPEKDNIVFARLMDAGKYLIAKIDEMVKKGSFHQIKIGIYLIDF
ncbi:MAG: HIRAN domain-containing protein [Lachnospiraceae bacterium]|nr:HIRAN domain-containing protein [Lachnospiraceae bacterium]